MFLHIRVELQAAARSDKCVALSCFAVNRDLLVLPYWKVQPANAQPRSQYLDRESQTTQFRLFEPCLSTDYSRWVLAVS